MQEVKGVIDGDLDYKKLKGDTGPLVYPAGFVYIYSILYFITDHGTNILKAQYIFLLLHVAFIYVFIKLLMQNTKQLPLWVVVFSCISRRIHSIFVLRLFNDCFAVFFCYLSLLLFCSNRTKNSPLVWSLASVIYSFAVSIKMNILLYCPAIGLLYFKYLGFKGTIKQVTICVVTQLVLGAPFLITHPLSYISRAFNFSKDFEYKWSVNFKFLSEELFLNKTFGHFLLAILVIMLLSTAHFVWCVKEGGLIRYLRVHWDGNVDKYKNKKKKKNNKRSVVDGEYFLDRLFLCNFMGIVFAKSLHYQFYVWYFHTLPYLAWRSRSSLLLKWMTVLCFEILWNWFPSNHVTSLFLCIIHLELLYGVLEFQYAEYAKKKRS